MSRTSPRTSTCGRRSSPAGPASPRARSSPRSIDLAPTLAFILGIPEPQHSQGKVLLDVVKGGNGYKPISIVGLNDFHGQLDPATLVGDNGISSPVGGAAFLATMFDEEFASLGQNGLLLAAGDNVGASPPNSGAARGHAGDRRREPVGPRRDLARQPRVRLRRRRLLEHIERADFPFLATNIVEEATGELPDWLEPRRCSPSTASRSASSARSSRATPELVSAGATAGLDFLAEAPRIKAESERLEALGVHVQVVVIHQGTSSG